MNCLCCGLYNHFANIFFYLLDYLVSIAKKKPDDKGDIVIAGIINFIARKFGVNVSEGINRIEENNYLNLDTLTSMLFLKPFGLSHKYKYE